MQQNDILTIPADFTPSQSTLAGRVILVTMAASEIGSAVALAAAKSGAVVLMLDRKQHSMAALYDAICAQGLAQPMMIEFDMVRADADAFATLGTSLLVRFPEIHGLVHCAMWAAALTPAAHAEMEAWAKVLEQQLIKPMYLTKTLYPNLNHPKPASVVFTVMDIGRVGRAYWGAVGAAFAGVENFCESLSAELFDYNTRVNTLDLGKVKTATRKHFYPAETDKDLRAVNDVKIVNAYLYLLSDASNQQTAKRFSVAPLEG